MNPLILIVALLVVGYFIYSKVTKNKLHNLPASGAPSNGNPTQSGSGVEYLNNTNHAIIGVNFVSLSGESVTNFVVEPGQSICVQEGTLNGGNSGYLVQLGAC